MAETDIIISGAGIAGLIAAALLAGRGHRVTVLDPTPPPETAEAEGSDLRSTAYLEPSRALLEEAGLWAPLVPHATPLRGLRVIDTTGWPPERTDKRLFLPSDLGLEAFGWNVPNWRARKVLTEALADLGGVDLRMGTGFAAMLARSSGVRVTLSDGARLDAALIVGADGRNSPVRQAAGIGVDVRRYGQTALAFAVTHGRPHGNISTEIYNSGGAFTIVPLGDEDGRPASAIVWMNDGRRAKELLAMDRRAFETQMVARATAILGRMEVASPIREWPIVTQTAQRLTARRTAIVAEAAHVLPPIGAQGLNTSIADIAALTRCIDAGDPGADRGLDAYAAARGRDIRLRAGAIDLFNRICQSGAAPVQGLRRLGLRGVHDLMPLRLAVMRAGMGRG